MHDVNLLIFGCAVTFIAVGGAYVYIRECFMERKLPSESLSQDAGSGREAA